MEKSRKVFLGVFLSLLLVLAFCYMPFSLKKDYADAASSRALIFSGVLDTTFLGGGTESNPYRIDDEKKLIALSYNVFMGNSYSSTFFSLTKNTYDLIDYYWIPIGSESHPFAGTLTAGIGIEPLIKNLKIDANELIGEYGPVEKRQSIEEYQKHMGLIGYTSGNNVKVTDIKFQNVEIDINPNTVTAGTLAGFMVGRVANVAIIAPENDGKPNYIKYETVAANVNITNLSVGGIVGSLQSSGYLDGITNVNIKISCNNITESYNNFIGGLAGENDGTVIGSTFTNGSISAYQGYIGGIVGRNARDITRCENRGNVEGQVSISTFRATETEIVATKTFLGGIAGISGLIGTITDCNNPTNEVQACRGSVGGIVGQNQGTVKNCNNNVPVRNSGNLKYMGGIVGINGGTISKSKNYGACDFINDSSFKVNSVGGIAGLNDSSNTTYGGTGTGNGLIIGCSNYGDICKEITADYAGGIAGVNAKSEADTVYNISSYDKNDTDLIEVVKNCGTVRGNLAGGGIVGQNYGNIKGAINMKDVSGVMIEGEITSTSNAKTGGIVGEMLGGQLVIVANHGNIIGGSNCGGIAGNVSASGAKIQKAYNYGNVTSESGTISFAGGMVGLLGNFQEISEGYSVGKISTVGISGVTNRGGLVGRTTQTSGLNIKSVAYSTDIANYEETAVGYENNLNVIANLANFGSATMKLKSYQMVLPFVLELTTALPYYALYSDGTNRNPNWEFGTQVANYYYYPVLTLFKNNNVYGTEAGQVEQPKEIIHKTEMFNQLPKWQLTGDTGQTVYTDEPIGGINGVQYIVSGHKLVQPSETDYKHVVGHTSTYLKGSQEFDFGTAITENCRINLTWFAKNYNINYYIKIDSGEFVAISADEAKDVYGLTTTTKFSLDPSALVRLKTISQVGYTFSGFWIFDALQASVDTSKAGTTTTQFYSGNALNEFDYSYYKDFTDGIFVYAHLEPYTVSVALFANYDGYPGSTIPTVTLKYGTTEFNFGNIPDISGVSGGENKTFKGWYSDRIEGSGVRYSDINAKLIVPFTPPLSQLTLLPNGTYSFYLYAQWANSKIRVIFVDPYTMGSEYELATIQVPYSTPVNVRDVTLIYPDAKDRNGFEVDNYYTDTTFTNLFDFTNDLIAETKIYIKWTEKYFTIIINADGGMFSNGKNNITLSTPVKYMGDVYSALAGGTIEFPVKTGNTVASLNGHIVFLAKAGESNTRITSDYKMPANDLTVYIAWNKNKYDVILNANGGHYANDTVVQIFQMEYGTSVLQALNGLAVEEPVSNTETYRFKNFWTTEADNDATKLTNSVLVPENGLTLYAAYGEVITVVFLYLNNHQIKEFGFIGQEIQEPDYEDMINGTFKGWYLVTNKDSSGVTLGNEITFPFVVDKSLAKVDDTIMIYKRIDIETKPEGNNNTLNYLLIALGVIVGIVAILFIIIFTGRHRNTINVNSKKVKTDETRTKLEELKRKERDRNKFGDDIDNNPFND